jgi:ABC-type polysaccharide/polyol phosphate export permease
MGQVAAAEPMRHVHTAKARGRVVNRHCSAFLAAIAYLCLLIWVGGAFGTAWAAALFALACIAAAKLAAEDWSDW